MKYFALFSNQLFDIKYFKEPCHILLILHPKFFKDDFIWVKLVYNYACVLYYIDYIKNTRKFKITVLNYLDKGEKKQNIDIQSFDPIEKDLITFLKKQFKSV
jgi:hypothetical protein